MIQDFGEDVAARFRKPGLNSGNHLQPSRSPVALKPKPGILRPLRNILSDIHNTSVVLFWWVLLTILGGRSAKARSLKKTHALWIARMGERKLCSRLVV